MKRARFDGFFWAVSAGQTLAAPVLLFKKWRRFRARGDAYEWDWARWGGAVSGADSVSPSDSVSGAENCADLRRPHLVLVAMGFAETRLAARLTTLLQAEMPGLRVTWAIRNLDAARQGGAVPAPQKVVPLPFDYFVPVARWMDEVSPDAVVFIERFQFPILARGAHNYGVKVAAVAARSRAHRGGRYRFGGFYARWLLRAFDLLCFRSQVEVDNLGEIPAATRVRLTGSLKSWPQLPPLEAARENALQAWLQSAGGRPIVAAGSTQPGDENWVLDAFLPLQKRFGAVLLLAPRHVNRADEVAALCESRGLKISRRSAFAPDENSGAGVFLLDTLGELTHAYGAARAAFIGGTLTGTGHNVLEPIAHGIPVFFGPKRGTFGAEQDACIAAGVGIRVASPQELEAGFARAITDENWRAQIAQGAAKLGESGARAWDETVAALVEMLREMP